MLPSQLLPRQRENHIRVDRRRWIPFVIGNALRQVAVAACYAQRQIFATSDFVDCGDAVGTGGEIFLPQNFAGVLIEGADFAVGCGGRENQAARRYYRTSAGIVRAGVVDALLLKTEDSAIGNLPLDGTGVEIVGCQVRPRRSHRREAVAL